MLLLLLPLASPTSPLHISSLLVPSLVYENSSISLSCTYSLAVSQPREEHGCGTLQNHILLEENLV